MLFQSHPSSGLPVYLQLIDQVKHAIDVGALRPGDQLPSIRRVADDLVINPNTVAKAYRDLERDGVIELRQGAGAFVAENNRESRVKQVKAGQTVLRAAVEQLTSAGLTLEEVRRLFDAEMLRRGNTPRGRN